VLWIEQDATLAPDIRRARVSTSLDSGVSWNTPQYLSSDSRGVVRQKIISSDDGSTLTAIWSRSSDEGVRLVEATSSTNFGVTWSAPTRLNTVGGDFQQITSSSDGMNQVVVWVNRTDNDNIILSASSTNAGASWTQSTEVSNSSSQTGSPVIAVSSDGTTNAFAIWSETNNNTDVWSLKINSYFSIGDPNLCNGLTPTIIGTEGDDVLTGTAGVDVIAGLGGDDIIYGLEGEDVICGGDGNDTIDAGPQKDIVYGGNGHDTIFGRGGWDDLFGGAGDDVIHGNAGNDTIKANGGFDSVRGGNGDDNINGGNGNDTLSGGEGDDTINGGNQNDVLKGGAGTDTCTNGELEEECGGSPPA